jgi:hypothetical protein
MWRVKKWLRRLDERQSAAISILFHVILVALFGGTVLFKQLEPPPDFSADGGFLGDASEANSPPGPPAVDTAVPELSTMAVPQPLDSVDVLSVLSTTSASAPVFTVPTISAPLPGSSLAPDLSAAAAKVSAASAQSLSGGGGSGSWGKSSGKGSWGQGFGSMEKDDLKLVGRLYDLKQDRKGKPTPITPEEFWKNLRSFLDSDLNPERLKNFFESKPVYTAQIFIPFQPASDGPRAFGLEGQVQPSWWLVHYQGGFSPPRTGRFRFWARADDALIVGVDGTTVLDVSRVNDGSFAEPKSAEGNPSRWKSKRNFSNDIPYPGDWMDLRENETYRLDIVVAEGQGGDFEALLMIEEGDSKNTAYSPQPVFSTLPLEGVLPTSFNAAKNVPVQPPAIFSPRKNVLKSLWNR